MPELGGYYWAPYSPTVIINRVGTNEYSETIALTVLPNYLDFARMWVVSYASSTWIQVGGEPVDSGPRLCVSGTFLGPITAIIGFENWASTWTRSPNYLVIELDPPVSNIELSVDRPTDFMGNPTGTLNWSIGLELLGILYLRGTFVDAGYAESGE